MAAGPMTPERRRALDDDRNMMHAFHAGVLARGRGRFWWARFPDQTDKDWTVVRIEDDGRADSIGWECGVDLREAELGPPIAEPGPAMSVEDLRAAANRWR